MGQRIAAQHHQGDEPPDRPLTVGVGAMSANPLAVADRNILGTDQFSYQHRWSIEKRTESCLALATLIHTAMTNRAVTAVTSGLGWWPSLLSGF